MDELILHLLSGGATPAQAERVREWRAASPDNEAYFLSIDRVWRATEPTVLTGLSDPVDPAVILAAAEERRRVAEGDVVSLASRRKGIAPGRGALRWSLAMAAAVVAVALGLRVGLPDRTPVPLATYTAQAGVARSVSLDDGTFVRLAPGSSLQVWESDSERRMTLSGRAFFAVARDEGRPFVVRAGASETRVLGTRFEVFDRGGDVRTVVVEGRVSVSNGQGTVEVTGGSVARAPEGGPPTVEVPEDVYALLDW
ncbi:MAG TPA: FecR domain-containing protein, partial [Longimicrobiales bacterium]|nr:FecR domain-containing protein [Longimicrobiales bacterium]